MGILRSFFLGYVFEIRVCWIRAPRSRSDQPHFGFSAACVAGSSRTGQLGTRRRRGLLVSSEEPPGSKPFPGKPLPYRTPWH